jgi:hypothetical protein
MAGITITNIMIASIIAGTIIAGIDYRLSQDIILALQNKHGRRTLKADTTHRVKNRRRLILILLYNNKFRNQPELILIEN